MKKIIIILIAIFCGMFGTVLSQEKETWTVRATDINPNNYYGVTVANGVIGLVSSSQPLQVNDVILNGVYDYYQRGRVSNILKSFNHVNMALDIDGRRIDRKVISNYAQELDMKQAILTTTFDIGNRASVRHELMALRHLPYTALSIVTIQAKEDITITPMSIIEAPVHLQEISNYFAEIDRPHIKVSLLTSVAKSPSGSITVAASNSFIFEEPHGEVPQLIHEDWDYNMHLAKFHLKLKAGTSYTFSIVSSTCSSVQYEDPHNEAERLSIYAMLEGKERLREKHINAWNELWQSNITIKGDPKLTMDIRFMLYHLYAFARAGTSYSLSPMGLSGLGYNGHVFWDTELWMYPPLLILQPEIARSLLEYRYERLNAAKHNAFAHGFKGAMFPWESAADGSEDTPVWALTGPFQHHITGCVGWAFWKYYQVTGDKKWLEERGWPVLKEVADFWCSRVERNGPGQYDILNVIGANEWAENIDNNAFTNGMAKTVLKYATQAGHELGFPVDPDWMHVSENIPLLTFPDGTTRENSTYQGELIKQADVNLLAYPLDVIRDPARIQKDLDFYYPRFAPDGPAMGAAIAAVLYSHLGQTNKAEQVLYASYKPNQVPPFGVIAETAGGTNPYFATGAGGTLQAILAGFGGLIISENGIHQKENTIIPTTWEELEITGVGVNKERFVVRKNDR
jgi:protein-glucosylgalactosylhydroxylysine glucosidase